MKRHEKLIVISLVTILIILASNIIISIYELGDYEKRKNQGNDRWKQVENRIIEIEKRVEKMEGETQRWKK